MYNRSSNQNKKLILSIVGLIFVLSLIVIGVTTYNANQKGEIKIVSVPDATVFIDNSPQSKTPFKTSLKPGEYVIKLVPNGEESSISASFVRKITVLPNVLTYISRFLGTSENTSYGEVLSITPMKTRGAKLNTGEIAVVSDPQGALVYLDNDEQGVTPLILKDVVRGDHELAVSLPNFVRHNVRIQVSEGYTVNADIKLALDETLMQKTATPEAVISSKSSSSSSSSKAKSSASSASSSSAKSASSSKSATLENVVSSLGKKLFTVEVTKTPTGFLRVRADATASSDEIAKLDPGAKVDVYKETNGWYQITITGGKVGWISAQYTKKL
jgi:hypothetical protein